LETEEEVGVLGRSPPSSSSSSSSSSSGLLDFSAVAAFFDVPVEDFLDVFFFPVVVVVLAFDFFPPEGEGDVRSEERFRPEGREGLLVVVSVGAVCCVCVWGGED